METKTFDMESHAFSIRFLSSRDSALGCIFSANSSSNLAGKEKDSEPCRAKSHEALSSGRASVQTHGPAFNEEQETEVAQAYIQGQETEVAQVRYILFSFVCTDSKTWGPLVCCMT